MGEYSIRISEKELERLLTDFGGRFRLHDEETNEEVTAALDLVSFYPTIQIAGNTPNEIQYASAMVNYLSAFLRGDMKDGERIKAYDDMDRRVR